MIDPNAHYRLRQTPKRDDGEFDSFTAEELLHMQFVEQSAGQPDDPCSPTGQWVCENSACDVREVTVSLVHLNGPPKKQAHDRHMDCPLCGKLMRFQHYVNFAALVPEQTSNLQRIKQTHDIADVIGLDMKLTPINDNVLKGVCPFHTKQREGFEFHVDRKRQNFTCFACNRYGDVIQYVQQAKGKTFAEALEYLESLPAKEGD